MKQLFVYTCQSGQRPRIHRIGFTVAGIDYPQLAGVRNDDLVSKLLQVSAYPGRMGSSLDRDSRSHNAAKLSCKTQDAEAAATLEIFRTLQEMQDVNTVSPQNEQGAARERLNR
jgi:hypothetical protein